MRWEYGNSLHKKYFNGPSPLTPLPEEEGFYSVKALLPLGEGLG
jgi:hypothetical protein